MTYDALQLLRDANPVTDRSSWSEDEIRAAVAAIVADDTVRTPSRRRWAVPALAAAAVVAVTVGVAVGIANVSHDDPTPVGGSGPVTCRVSTAGGDTPTSARLETAGSVIATRADALGSTGDSITGDAAAGTLAVRARGIDVDAIRAACRSTTTALRPVVVPAVPVDASAPTSAEPLKELGFRAPRDEGQAAALSAAQRARLATALTHADCRSSAADPDDDAPVVRCQTLDGRTSAYLLGPSLAGGADITEAVAVAPSVGSGGTHQWTVSLTFDTGAQRRIASFTTAHNTGGTDSDGSVTTCSTATSTPCSAYLAMEVDGRVRQVPVTNEPIVGVQLQVSGQFDATTAKGLAADYSAASIGLAPK